MLERRLVWFFQSKNKIEWSGIILNEIEILIVDDEVNWLKQITLFLNRKPDLLVVGTAKTKQEGCRLAQILNPHIILLDLYLEGEKPDGLTVLQELQTNCNAKIIVLTMEENLNIVKDALLSGATEYVVKENFKILPEIIRTAYKRQMPAEIMAQMAKQYILANKKNELLDELNLTTKEKEVFCYVECNLSGKEIAAAIGVEEKTIRNYITSINKKLNTKNSTQKAVEKVKNLLQKQLHEL
jgi:DNA-binding NarL/FixJ family response regulator